MITKYYLQYHFWNIEDFPLPGMDPTGLRNYAASANISRQLGEFTYIYATGLERNWIKVAFGTLIKGTELNFFHFLNFHYNSLQFFCRNIIFRAKKIFK